MPTPIAQQPSAPKKHKPLPRAPRSPPVARLTPPALPFDRGAPREELRAILAAAPPQTVDATPPLRPSALKKPPVLSRARPRRAYGVRRVQFPES